MANRRTDTEEIAKEITKQAETLVAKYVTSRTTASGLFWRNLYDFAEYCIRIGYLMGRKAERLSRKP